MPRGKIGLEHSVWTANQSSYMMSREHTGEEPGSGRSQKRDLSPLPVVPEWGHTPGFSKFSIGSPYSAGDLRVPGQDLVLLQCDED